MTLTKEQFREYFKKHKLACEEIVDAYMNENPQDEYHYEDIDAVYQRQVDAAINRRAVHSRSEGLPHGKKCYACAGGGYRTINGIGRKD